MWLTWESVALHSQNPGIHSNTPYTKRMGTHLISALRREAGRPIVQSELWNEFKALRHEALLQMGGDGNFKLIRVERKNRDLQICINDFKN